MTSTAENPLDGYLLVRDATEYERLRAQGRVWEPATAGVFEQIGLAPGASCLDAGCGPGHAMRLMAEHVGPDGSVTGVDLDADVGEEALALVEAFGHDNCTFERFDLESDATIPGEPFDLVYARLLVFHAHDQVAVLRRLWQAVAPGGHLVIHDYDMRAVAVRPDLASLDEWKDVVLSALLNVGKDVHFGHSLPLLFREAGLGDCDGTDVAGRLETLRSGGWLFSEIYRSILPLAIGLGLTSEAAFERWAEEFERDIAQYPGHALMWPLLIGAWKRKPLAP